MSALKLKNMTAFAYCEGAGSLLGIRLVAMAIRAWKEQVDSKETIIYAYNSLEASIEMIKKLHVPKEPFAVVSQSRKGQWDFLSSDSRGSIVTEVDEVKLISYAGILWLFKQKSSFQMKRI